MKKLFLLYMLFCAFAISVKAQSTYYPYVIGYAAGESQNNATDGFKTSFSGGSPFATTWKTHAEGYRVLLGFKHDMLFVENAFNKDLFASKGYYSDYVELRWDIVRYASQITAFKIFRKEVGSTDDSVMVANVASDTRSWKDEYSESGILYEYTLYADGITSVKAQKFLNFIQGIGFRVPTGRISGRVTYAGGAAVKGVNIIGETEDNFAGSSLLLDGSSSYLAISPPLNDPQFKFDTAFTFQAWVKVVNGASTSCIFDKQGQYKLTHSNGTLSFIVGGTQTLTLNFAEKVDTFFHVTAMRTADSLKLVVYYDDYATVYKSKAALTATTTANNNDFYIGKSSSSTQYFNGYIDEVRIWRGSFSEATIALDYGRYIAGTEANLSAYYRFNEGTGGNFYDLSRKGFTFNEHHGYKSPTVAWSAVVPFNRQLSVKGVTDSNGNYIISGIPYATDGSVYRFVPVFGIHSFDPTEKLLFLGPGSTTHGNIDFIDVASFPVRGEVYYRNTNFPVQGVSVLIDGQTAVSSNGLPITTDATGKFTVDVPIGLHYIELSKYGHGFVDNGRFPATEGDYFDFQQPYTFQTQFLDTTLVKVIGKVVGGPVQAAKPKGLGKTINNLGNATIKFSTQKGYDLTNVSGGVDVTNQNYSYEGAVRIDDGDTKQKIIAGNLKETVVEPDPSTGEYVAYFLPEKYTVTSIVAGTYTFDDSYKTTLDLTNAFFTFKEVDSVVTGVQISPTGEQLNAYRIDSVQYNKNLDFVYRTIPSISVTNENDSIAFWETEVEANDGTMVSVVEANGDPKTPWPIFIQRNAYKLKINVFERYTNANTTAVDDVPVKDGTVEIINALALDNGRKLYQISSQGVVNYEFVGGLPNIVGDFTQSMTIVAYTGNGGSIATSWQGNNAGSFKGYVFGGMPTGNNFVTTGPNQVDMILRDPYGSSSYSFLEKGSSVTKSSSYTVSDENNITAGMTFHFGANISTFVGLGAGVITETETEDDLSIGLESTQTWVDSKSTSTTITNTKAWQTSAEPDFVGANGDVFIGHSTNIVYGVSKMLTLLPDAQCTGCVGVTGAYDIGMYNTLRLSPKFATGFQYTQNHIENYLIPNLKMLRDVYLTNSQWHTSVDLLGSEDYGKSNTAETTNTVTNAGQTTITVSGDHYSYQLIVGGVGANWPSVDSLFTDSVKFFNQQIKGWEDLLARNEREKRTATLVDNLSFDAGTVYSSSVTVDEAEAVTSSFEFSVSPTIATEFGVEVMGVGFDVSLSETYTNTQTDESGTETTSSVTFGYELSDPDEGDYFSIDVKEPSTSTGPVFALRGGQSQCPHEAAEYTEYDQPGTIISESSMQREVPVISCTNPIQVSVPDDQAAVFNVQLGNASETGDDAWYMVAIDESSNQAGAIIEMDGASIGNGRIIYVPAGAAINKVITVKLIQPASVYDYEDIGIILHSVCQFSSAFPDLSDTVKITARFQPVCTSVNITSPNDLWVINSNTTTDLPISIGGYNLSHNGFEKILFQYKPISSSQWITEKSYYYDINDYNNAVLASQPAEYLNNQASISFNWDMSSLQDRKYNIRAVATCSSTPNNNSVSLTGIKDTKRPKVFGTPQPGDGILEPGDDVMITFDEPIQEGLILGSNFSVRGVLNGAELTHNTALYFDGVDDYLSAIAGVGLKDNSFAIEFWTKRAALTPGVIFQQADIEIGFNSSNQMYVRLGNNTQTTSQAYNFTDKWIHFTTSFDNETRKLNVHVIYDGYSSTDLSNADYPGLFEGNGKMYIGNDQNLGSAFNGYMHDLRVWQRAVGFGEANSNKLISLTGNEVDLGGFWPMNELRGDFAGDLVKAHNATIYGPTWQVFPSSYARTFDGSSHVEINSSSSVIITDQMDFTMEFWFKGAPQSNTVLFSNGKADGSETPDAYSDIWVVGFDANGKLYAMNNGTTITNNTTDVLDNAWHHFALVLRRKGNTSMYVDGSLISYAQSVAFGGLKANAMALGASRHYTNGAPYSNQFTGAMDEVRFWKLARTEKLIGMDMNSKLKGDEKGLVAYYPFDKYDITLVLQPSLDDCDLDDFTEAASGLVASTVGSGTFDNTNVPSIKDARPAQNLAFNWVVNNDKIIINLEEPADLIEKCVIEFTVDRIEDLNENRMASPETWTAYIKKNTVVWDRNDVSLQKLVNDPLSFTVDVINKGGVDQVFNITNLPSWLSASTTTASLTPDSRKTVTFTVDPSVNIGNYDVSLYLGSDFGYKEKLNLTLKVYQTPPTWTVNPSSFQYSMSVIGQVKIDGIFSTNTDDMVGAFVNNECRGVAQLRYIEDYDMFEAFLNIYSNVESGENIVFKIWNASEGVVHVNVTPQITFEYNTFYGTPSTPIVFESNNSYSKEIDLTKGWKWISFNLNDPDLSDVNALLSDMTFQTGDQIKGQTAFDNYGATYGWSGSLSATGGFDLDKMYMIKSSNVDTIRYAGSKVNTLATPITINQGWNWIGYTPQSMLSLSNALSNFNATAGDVIKSQYKFAMYDAAMGWIGSLDYLKGGEGYMYKSNNVSSTSFVYPNVSSNGGRMFADNLPAVNVWEINREKYQHNMSVIAEIGNANFEVDNRYVVGAFVGDECRGIAEPVIVNNSALYFITIYSDANETVSFKLINTENNVVVDFNENETFSANKLMGNNANPYPLTITDVTGLNSSIKNQLSIFPNPAKNTTTIQLTNGDKIESLELIDITGKVVFKGKANDNKFTLDLSKYSGGTYFLKVESTESSLIDKLILVK